MLLLIIPILTAGFLTCNYNPKYSYRLHRFEGQHLYLKAASLGLKSFLIALLLVLLINNYFPPRVGEVSIDLHTYVWFLFREFDIPSEAANQYSWLFILSIAVHLIAAIACIWQKIWRLVVSKFLGIDSKFILMYEILKDSPLDAELFRSYAYQKPVLISLSTRKVYVGVAISLGEPNENEGMDQEISIVPIMSGYRDNNNLNVIFDTDYKTVSTDDDLKVTIRQELIDSVSRFNFDVYESFQKQKKSR